jgi:hypothetical protein
MLGPDASHACEVLAVLLDLPAEELRIHGGSMPVGV